MLTWHKVKAIVFRLTVILPPWRTKLLSDSLLTETNNVEVVKLLHCRPGVVSSWYFVEDKKSLVFHSGHGLLKWFLEINITFNTDLFRVISHVCVGSDFDVIMPVQIVILFCIILRDSVNALNCFRSPKTSIKSVQLALKNVTLFWNSFTSSV